MAFWDGMDAQPVCQLFYTRGTKDLVVTYGNSIKFLNVFDLGDSLRHWRPQVSPMDASRGKVVLARARSATVADHEVHIAVEEHHKLAASAHVPTSNAALFRSVANFQHAAYMGFAGQHIWTKSGAAVRLWSTSRLKNSMGASPSSSGSFSPSPSSGALSSAAGKSSPHSESPARTGGTSRSGHFTSTISLYKELRSPNPDSSDDLYITPTILSMTGTSNPHKKAAHVFIFESPHRITQWDAYAASFTANLEQHESNPNIECMAVLADCLVAVARNRLYVWRAPSSPALASSASLSSSLTSSNALVVPEKQEE